MRPWRFICCFALNELFGVSTMYFFLFSAGYLQQSRIIFSGIVAVMLLAFLFCWLYFRGVPHLSWRARVEAVAVWFGLVVLIDMALLLFVHGKSLSDLTSFSLLSYALYLAVLFLAAYITAREHPRFSAPDLLMKESGGDEQA